MKKVQIFALSYFFGKNFFGDDGLQNYLTFQLLNDTLNRLTGIEKSIS